MIGVVGGLLYLDARAGTAAPGLLIIVLALGLLACRELIGLLHSRGLRTQPVLPYVGVVVVTASNWMVPAFPAESAIAERIGALGWPLLGLGATLAASFLYEAVRFRSPGGAVEAVATTLLVTCYLGVFLSFGVQIRWEGQSGPSGAGLWRVVQLVAAVKLGDIAAYAVGSAWGRRPLAPTLSPKKTVEGALGGVGGAVLGAVAVALVAQYADGIRLMSVGQALGFGLLIAPAAQLGDLIESLVKRDCQRKDSDVWLAGMGGTLDLLDSVLLACPVAYLFWVFM